MGLYLIAAGLLVVAGTAKAARPDDTARALVALLPSPPSLRLLRDVVRVGALVEAALGVVAFAFPVRPPQPSSPCPTAASSARWPTPADAAGPSPPGVASAAPTRHPPRGTWSSTWCWPPPPRSSPRAPRSRARWRRSWPTSPGPVSRCSSSAGGAVAHGLGPLRPGRAHRRAPPGWPAAGAVLVSLSTAVGGADGAGSRGAPVPAQPDQPVGLRRQRRGRRVWPRSRPQTGQRLRPDLRVRQRRLWLWQHLLLGVLGVLLRGERGQLLPRAHRHGRLVGGGQFVVLRWPPLLHGLHATCSVTAAAATGSPSARRAATGPAVAAARWAATPISRGACSSATDSATRTWPAWGASAARSSPACRPGRSTPPAPPPSPSTTARRNRRSRAGRRRRGPRCAPHPPRTARSSAWSRVPTVAATPS